MIIKSITFVAKPKITQIVLFALSPLCVSAIFATVFQSPPTEQQPSYFIACVFELTVGVRIHGCLPHLSLC